MAIARIAAFLSSRAVRDHARGALSPPVGRETLVPASLAEAEC
jgi:hypothetical protein